MHAFVLATDYGHMKAKFIDDIDYKVSSLSTKVTD